MSLFFDSFWRAVAYCLHPRVIALSLLPLVAMIAIALGLGYFFWDDAVNSVFLWLESSDWLASITQWLTDMGMGGLKNALAPLLVIFAITPLLVVVVLFFVALLMAPAVVNLVSRRRFPDLERKHGASFARGALWSLGSMLLALLALLISLPLWLIPPLILLLPPLIWGWLTYRVMSYDVLADHASRDERRELMRRHRGALFGIGVVTGYLGAAPSLVWVSGAMAVVLAPLLVPLAIWVYTLVFAFSALWFAHYALAALQALRAESMIIDAPPAPASPPRPPLPPVSIE
ncbi:EI24 domain-containing protein [Piscinibacter sp.]|uniref:EI24 domain-containing protein n=1 Tax=Piscinibacter sp. TaxID=1903157 RepID=UPI002F40AF4E